MEIIYPPLVEQSMHYQEDKTYETIEKAAMYRLMVAKGIITQNGLPTMDALVNGWIKDFSEEEDLSFTEFLAIYPVFEKYNKKLFKKIDGFWEIQVAFKEELLNNVQEKVFSDEEQLQIEAYLSDR